MIDSLLLDSIVKKIDNSKKILLLTHIDPDADTLGCALAIYDMLCQKQKKAVLFNASETIGHNLKNMPHMSKLQKKLPDNYDLAISFDCATLERLGVRKIESDLINIDHHISNNNYGTINFINTTCVSTTQMVYELFKAACWKISSNVAQSLYLGLISDSLNFTTSKVTKDVFIMATNLVELGANPKQGYQMLFEQNSLAKIRLTQLILKSLSLSHDARVALILATQAMFKESGAQLADTQDSLNIIMSMGIIDSVILLKEGKDGFINASLRSKSLLDVNIIASNFGGGGHVDASGFRVKENLENISKRVLEIITKELI